MSRVNIEVQELDVRNKFATPDAFSDITTAVDATDGAEVEWAERDDKYLLLFYNSGTSATNATIKAGNGIQGVNDTTISIPASKYTFISIDSGRFKNVSGSDKGKVIIAGGSSDIEVAVFKLP